MSQIIPRDLVRHLEWVPGKEPPIQKNPSKSQNSGKVQVQTDFSKYIQVEIDGIRGNPVVISPFELEGYNDKNYANTHVQLLKSGLYMPTPRIITTHLKNLIQAVNGDKTLRYADGDEVPENLVNDMYQHMTTNFMDVYNQNNPGVWTWLNARFVNGSGFNELDMETVVDFADDKQRKLKTTKEPLEECLWKDGLADLSFNSQGLVTADTSDKKYIQGKNLYFWNPRKDAVARFYADSYWAYLVCSRDPTVTNSSLGLFGCAEGAAATKIPGGTK